MRIFGGGSDDDDDEDDSEWRYSLDDLDDLDEEDPAAGNAPVDRDAAGRTADLGTGPAETGDEGAGNERAGDEGVGDERTRDEGARDERTRDEGAGDTESEGGGAGVAGSFEPSETIEPGDVDLENAAFVLLGVLVAAVAAGHYVMLAL